MRIGTKVMVKSGKHKYFVGKVHENFKARGKWCVLITNKTGIAMTTARNTEKL